jgi:hypothetical protein
VDSSLDLDGAHHSDSFRSKAAAAITLDEGDDEDMEAAMMRAAEAAAAEAAAAEAAAKAVADVAEAIRGNQTADVAEAEVAEAPAAATVDHSAYAAL